MDIAALVVTAVLLAPVAVLCVECLVACVGRRPRSGEAVTPAARVPLAVLIPAHNEQVGLPATLRSVKAQLLPHDRVVVVADNCTDGTAALAREAGVTVIER